MVFPISIELNKAWYTPGIYRTILTSKLQSTEK